MRVVCVGAGPAGLYFAITMKLRDRRHDVVVLERSPERQLRGLGLVFWDPLRDQLRRNDPTSARMIEEAMFILGEQQIVLDGHAVVDPGTYGYSISRPALVKLLASRAQDLEVRIRFDHEAGERDLGDADLVVGADGINSMVRSAQPEAFGSNLHTGKNWHLWLETDAVYDSWRFTFVPAGPGWIWAAIYAIDTRSSTFLIECTPQAWSHLQMGELSDPQALSVLQELFAADLAGHRLISREPIRWSHYPTVTNQRWFCDNRVLIGDAAHTTHFSIGSGTRLGMEDAVCLADELHRHPETAEALAAYQGIRKAAVVAPQLDARHSQQWLEHVDRYTGLRPHQFYELWKRRRSPLQAHMAPRAYLLIDRVTSLPALVGARRRAGAWARRRRGASTGG